MLQVCVEIHTKPVIDEVEPLFSTMYVHQLTGDFVFGANYTQIVVNLLVFWHSIRTQQYNTVLTCLCMDR